MLLRTHLVFSLLIFFIALPFIEEKILFFTFLMFATAFVDIDCKTSKTGNHILLRPFQFFISHRGILHTLFAAVILSGIVYFFTTIGALAFFIGYISHLALDMLTLAGIKPLHPILSFNIGFIIKTGGLFENILFFLISFWNILLIIKIF